METFSFLTRHCNFDKEFATARFLREGLCFRWVNKKRKGAQFLILQIVSHTTFMQETRKSVASY